MKANYLFFASLSLQLALTSCETAPLESPKSALVRGQAAVGGLDSSQVTAAGLFDIRQQQPGGPHLRDTVRVKFRNLQPEAIDYMIQLRVVYAEPVDGLYSQVLGAQSTGLLPSKQSLKLVFDSRGLPLNSTSEYRAEVFTRGIYYGDFAVEKR